MPPLVFTLVVLLLFGCRAKSETELFVEIPSSISGIDFENTVRESKDLNILNFHYLYNGGGVGIGDFNTDGLPDAVLTANQSNSAIYLNTGQMKFRQIPGEVCGFQLNGWATGVAIVDINNDGKDDIYISVGGLNCNGDCPNKLYINTTKKGGEISFRESAKAMGLADSYYNQQALFMDLDYDGDLDVYLVRNVIDRRDKNAPSIMRFINKKSTDQILLNQQIETGNLVFAKADSTLVPDLRGYGLGVAANDLNQDGLIDLYVANDFLSNDHLLINQGHDEHGRWLGFKNEPQVSMSFSSYNAMGVDATDINGDQLPDILTVDMLPDTYERLRSMQGLSNPDKLNLSKRRGYTPQFVRNTLQLQAGISKAKLPLYTEHAWSAGMAATDWSWAPLIADLDNDSDRDVLITNGYGRDITDLDFMTYTRIKHQSFGSDLTVFEGMWSELKNLREVRLPNRYFEQTSDFTFQDQTGVWATGTPTISNGIAYADFDLDGDLDLLINNLNDPATLLENTTEAEHFIRVDLKGTQALGAVVKIISSDSVEQQAICSTIRGYLSSVEQTLHFGLGSADAVSSLEIIWPDGTNEVHKNLIADKVYTYTATPFNASSFIASTKPRIEPNLGEDSSTPFEVPVLKIAGPQQQELKLLSDFLIDMYPPAIDSKDGAIYFPAQPGSEDFIAFPKAGGYSIQWLNSSSSSSGYGVWFDLDGDGLEDLYRISRVPFGSSIQAPRPDSVFLRNADGSLELSGKAVPALGNRRSIAVAVDIDGDGDQDVFVGSGSEVSDYPNIPESYLLFNEGGALMLPEYDVDDKALHLGLLTSATVAELDGDILPELVVVGHWMSPQIIEFDPKSRKIVRKKLSDDTGLFNVVSAKDLNGDGISEIVIGNRGINSHLFADTDHPLRLNTIDLDGNGSIDPIIAKYFKKQDGTADYFIAQSADEVYKWMPSLKRKYRTYASLGSSSYKSILKSYGASSTQHQLEVTQLQSLIFISQADGSLIKKTLPRQAQQTSIYSIFFYDLDEDGTDEIILHGNNQSLDTNAGYIAGGLGCAIKLIGATDIEVTQLNDRFKSSGNTRGILLVQDSFLLFSQAHASAIWRPAPVNNSSL